MDVSKSVYVLFEALEVLQVDDPHTNQTHGPWWLTVAELTLRERESMAPGSHDGDSTTNQHFDSCLYGLVRTRS